MSIFRRKPTDPLEVVEKQLEKEAKDETKHVNHTMKDFSSVEKDAKKALKSFEKAEQNLIKATKAEHDAAKALIKAQKEHDVAIQKKASAEKDVELRKTHNEKLKADLAAKRSEVDKVIEEQRLNDQARETRKAEIHTQRAGSVPSTASPPPGGNGSGSHIVSPTHVTSPTSVTSSASPTEATTAPTSPVVNGDVPTISAPQETRPVPAPPASEPASISAGSPKVAPKIGSIPDPNTSA